MGGDTEYSELQQTDDAGEAASPDDDKEIYRYPGKELGRVKRYLVNGGFDNKFDDESPPPKGVAPIIPFRA